MENPPPSPQGVALLPPKDSGVAGGGGDGVLSPKEPNTMPPKEQRSTKLELLLPLAAAERPTQQPSPSTAVLSTASKHAAVDDTTPLAVTTTTKPSPLIDPNDASRGTRDRTQPVIFSSRGVAAVPSVTASSNPHNKDLSNSNSSDTPIPAAPPMRFTSSIFSSASMPIPDLAASQSFGPHGFLATAAASTAPPLLAYTSTGHSLIGAPLLNTPVPVTAGDLTMAASALLDLTPAVAANSKRNQVDLNNNDNHQKPAPKRGKSLRRSAASVASTTAIRTTAPTTMTAVRPARTSRFALAASRARHLLDSPPRTTLACKCKNTQCLKLYCQCFQTGTVCDELICQCKDCHNTIKESQPRGSRTIAIHEILHRRPDAFEPRLKKKTGQGCSCKKSK